MAEQGIKPYVKLASTLVVGGMGIFTIERYGLSEMTGSGRLHLDPNVMSAMVLLPIALVAAGALVFVYGKLRRL